MTTREQTPEPGVRLPGVSAWYGIRYARADRFRAPQRVAWEPTADYSVFGAAPMQTIDPNLPLGADRAEDCHFLNVWAPADASDEPLPVYVAVYGGGFEHGAGSSWPLDGSTLARTGRVIVVSLNYRVGVLGFLSLNTVGDAFPDAHNLGLQDVIAALGWIRDNISRFGGDPNRVSVVGESAGGFIAAALLAAPAADGLFQRVAVHSAGASRIVPAGRATEMAEEFLRVTQSSADPAALADREVTELLDAQGHILATDIGVRNGPSPQALGIVDDSAQPGGILAMHPAEAVARGHANGRAILASSAQDEIAMFRLATADTFDPDSLEEIVAEATGWGISTSRAEALVEHYREQRPDDDLGSLRASLLTDYIYRLPTARLAQSQADAGGRAHLLMIGGVDGQPAGHAVDVPALAGLHWPDGSDASDRRDDEITRVVLDFVADGDPGWAAVAQRTASDPVQAAGSTAVPTADSSAAPRARSASITPVNAQGIAELRTPAGQSYAELLAVWDGVPRP
ncbi:MAG: carboxylesterase family protein [Mycetocola sp.]